MFGMPCKQRLRIPLSMTDPCAASFVTSKNVSIISPGNHFWESYLDWVLLLPSSDLGVIPSQKFPDASTFEGPQALITVVRQALQKGIHFQWFPWWCELPLGHIPHPQSTLSSLVELRWQHDCIRCAITAPCVHSHAAATKCSPNTTGHQKDLWMGNHPTNT